MTRLFTYAAIVTLGAAATMAVSPRAANPGNAAASRFANDGAFRDGLYLGKLAADEGKPMSIAIGRWSREQDRAMFTAGYRSGYSGASATARPGNGLSTE